jgi:Zn-dependent peptidase ImmA (M78 family)
LDTSKLCDFLKTVYPVDFYLDHNLPDGVLGKIEFKPTKIYISKKLRSDLHRWRFTLAHEIGHLILHSKPFEGRLAEKTDDNFSLSFSYNVSEMTSKRIELQANIFASHLLLPMDRFTEL